MDHTEDSDFEPESQIITLLGIYMEEKEKEFLVEKLNMNDTRDRLLEADPELEDDEKYYSTYPWENCIYDGMYVIEDKPNDSVLIHVRVNTDKMYQDIETEELGLWLNNVLDKSVSYDTKNYTVLIRDAISFFEILGL